MSYAETKKDRFKRVASKRVKRILESIKSLSNCSNLNNYDYSEDEVNKMFKAIKEELKLTEIMYRKKFNQEPNNFKF